MVTMVCPSSLLSPLPSPFPCLLPFVYLLVVGTVFCFVLNITQTMFFFTQTLAAHTAQTPGLFPSMHLVTPVLQTH